MTVDPDLPELKVQPESRQAEITEAVREVIRQSPAHLGASALAARIRAAVPFGVELTSSTPMELARRYRSVENTDMIGEFTLAEIRHRTRSWRERHWQVIRDQPRSAWGNVAMDEALLTAVQTGRRGPTLRIWNWHGPAVIIGRTQSLSNEVDGEAAAARGMALARRMSGGGTMYIEPAGAVTYSLYIPEELLDRLTIRQSYEVCDAWVILAWRGMGIECHHIPVNDMAWSGGKIAGAAQARRKGAVLHHTTIAYSMNHADLAAVLRLGRERPQARGTPSAVKHVSPLNEQTTLSREEILQGMLQEFCKIFTCEDGIVTDEERTESASLMENKYTKSEWMNSFI